MPKENMLAKSLLRVIMTVSHPFVLKNNPTTQHKRAKNNINILIGEVACLMHSEKVRLSENSPPCSDI